MDGPARRSSHPIPAAPSATGGFVEVADRVWVARHDWLDVNVTVIAGETGLMLVDTLGSAEAAHHMIPGIRALSPLPLVAIVNTHDHFDHTFGNGAVRTHFGADAPRVIAHENAEITRAGEQAQAEYADSPEFRDDPHRDAVLATEVVPASQTFSSVWAVDLGERLVELIHPGRGHTAGDLVVHVPQADLLVAGDLVEESAPPSAGVDSYPLEWPATLDLLFELTGPGTVVVPGHGAVVDRDFVRDQRTDLGIVAETIRHLAGQGVPVDRALAEGEWPWSSEVLADAVRRGYAQLPRSARGLPLA